MEQPLIQFRWVDLGPKFPAVDWNKARDVILYSHLNDLEGYLDESSEAQTDDALIKLLECCKQLDRKRYLACLEWAYLTFDPAWSDEPITLRIALTSAMTIRAGDTYSAVTTYRICPGMALESCKNSAKRSCLFLK